MTRRLMLPILASLPGLVHAFTVKGSEPGAVLRDAAPHGMQLITLRQVHGAIVHRVPGDEEDSRRPGGPAPEARTPREGDALVTSTTGKALAIFVADCVPILVCDPRSRALAAVHAGWRGSVAGVLRRTIETLRHDYGARPEDLRVGLGPAIGSCCFEVGDDVVERFLAADPGAEAGILRVAGHRPRVDLIEVNRRQALSSGVPAARIASMGLCTRCEAELLESYRRNGPGAGRMAGIIGWAS